MEGQADLSVGDTRLKSLAEELADMSDHLEQQVRRMDAVVDSIEDGWRGPTGRSYRALHRGVAEDAVRLRGTLRSIERAVRLSRDGFTEQELDVLQTFRQVESDVVVATEARQLSAPGQDTASDVPRSRLSGL